MSGGVESRGWILDTLYDGCIGGWAVRIGQTIKYAVRVGGHCSHITAHVVEGPFGLDVEPDAEAWAHEHTKLGMPVPPIPHATRARNWLDRFKYGGRDEDQNTAVPRVGRWSSDIGEIITPIVAVCRHENGIPVVAEWIAEDPTYFAEEEAKLIAAFERERERVREYDEDDEEHGRREPMTRTTKCDRHESDDGSSGLRDSLINVLLVLVIVFFLVYFGKGCMDGVSVRKRRMVR